MTRLVLLAGLGATVACGGAEGPGPDVVVVTPGQGIGPITLGLSWASVRDTMGAPPSEPVVLVRVGIATWPDRGLEVLVTSPSDDRLTDDAIVVGVGASRGATLHGLEIDALDRSAALAALGPAPEEYAGHAYYPDGLALAYGDDDRVDKVAVFAGYALAPDPPPMRPAAGASP